MGASLTVGLVAASVLDFSSPGLSNANEAATSLLRRPPLFSTYALRTLCEPGDDPLTMECVVEHIRPPDDDRLPTAAVLFSLHTVGETENATSFESALVSFAHDAAGQCPTPTGRDAGAPAGSCSTWIPARVRCMGHRNT